MVENDTVNRNVFALNYRMHCATLHSLSVAIGAPCWNVIPDRATAGCVPLETLRA
jgi:hypothetical protein